MGKERKRVLIVDDSIVIQRLVSARLKVDGFDVIAASNGQQGLDKLRENDIDVILLDVDMPVLNGYETIKAIKGNTETNKIPVIFITAQAQTEDKVYGLDLGAIDFVIKPFDPIELRARVRSASRTKYLVDLLENRAQVDGLTGLWNRAYFNDKIAEELSRAERYGRTLSLVMTDIDKFKSLNDNHGHLFGDTVLMEVAEAARHCVRTTDSVCRYGGEEFAILLPEVDVEAAGAFAERLRHEIEQLQLDHNGAPVRVTSSFGIAAITAGAAILSAPELIAAADKSLYHSKENGRNQVSIWLDHIPIRYPLSYVTAPS